MSEAAWLPGDLLTPIRPGPHDIIADAMARNPVAIFAMFSGGDGSLAATHWAMNNVPGCRVAHIVTGVGIPAVETYVRETCRREGWDLTVIRAKEDCGQDYDEIVSEHGFPGPAAHGIMYNLLKLRAVEKLIRENKTKRVGHAYGLGQMIRAFYACGTVIELDEDYVSVSVGDY